METPTIIVFLAFLVVISVVIILWVKKKKRRETEKDDIEDFVKWFINETKSRGVYPELHTQSTESGTDSTDGRFRPTLESNVVSDFRRQATNTQYAVLILCSEQGLRAVRGKPKINPRVPCMPNKEHLYDDYLVARPHNGQHSETIILERFDSLWEAYRSKRDGVNPVSVFLYSWLMPCTECTNEILDTLKGKNVTVAYTSKNYEENENEQIQEKNRERLRRKGFTVQRVRCKLYS